MLIHNTFKNKKIIFRQIYPIVSNKSYPNFVFTDWCFLIPSTVCNYNNKTYLEKLQHKREYTTSYTFKVGYTVQVGPRYYYSYKNMQWEKSRHLNKMGHNMHNGKATKSTFTCREHTRDALESTLTPRRQGKSSSSKDKNSYGRSKIISG